ncbi:MAG: RIP metalloprotease RseP [Pyrinomonadaceae bacterium]|nr:RIP metalloprotease RseP [Pyrinomonadaceae bacterium]
MSYIIGGLAFIFILGAAVVIHEFGHFAVAKLLKIRVETFSVGFGPRLFGRKWGHTDYRVSAIPLGGYVKLGGDESNAPIEGEGASDIPPEEQFNLRPKWQRIAVAVAGPVMNILTALAIPLGAAMLFGIPVTPTSPVVSRIAPGSAAEAAGLQPGDRIVSFNGVENPTWDRIRGDALVVPDQPQPIPMAIERGGARQQLSIVPKVRKEGTETVGDLGFLPDYGLVPVVIDRVSQGAAADRAQLKPGDRLLAIDGEQIRNSEQATQYIREFKGEQLRLTIERDGQQMEIASGVDRERDDKGNERARLGVGLVDDPPRQRVGPVAATSYAVNFNLEILRLTGKALSQFFTGQRSARNTISGPIGIARAASTSANELGWGGVFGMLGFLSLSLGVFNLLPIPVLDGGAIFILLLEAVLGVVGIRLSMAIRERIQQVGFVMLLLLMVFVISNDLLKEASIWRGGSNKPPAQTAPAPQK